MIFKTSQNVAKIKYANFVGNKAVWDARDTGTARQYAELVRLRFIAASRDMQGTLIEMATAWDANSDH